MIQIGLTDGWGEESTSWLEDDDLRSTLEDEAAVYVQVDGSMILTRGRINGRRSDWAGYSEVLPYMRKAIIVTG